MSSSVFSEQLPIHRKKFTSYSHTNYILKRTTPIAEIVLQPGETDAVKWVTFSEVHQMIQRGEVCKVIADQFLRQEEMLRAGQDA